MDWGLILDFVISVLLVALGWLLAYYKGSPGTQEKTEGWLGRLRGYAAEYIARAEAEFEGIKRGGDKFEWVVSRLYSLLPTAVKPFVTVETIGNIVQDVFDNISAYTKLQLDKWVDDTLSEDDKEHFKEG